METKTIANWLGKRIRERAESLDLNRQRLANLAGITWANADLYWRGQRIPELPTLCRIAKALDWTVSEFLSGIETAKL